jgi:hypothetical protein
MCVSCSIGFYRKQLIWQMLASRGTQGVELKIRNRERTPINIVIWNLYSLVLPIHQQNYHTTKLNNSNITISFTETKFAIFI